VRRVRPVVVALAMAALAGPAQAQVISRQVIAIGVPEGGKVLSETDVPVTVKGGLVVSFRGDAAAGCASYGLCSYTGTVIARPTEGDVTIATVRQHKRIEHIATLILDTGENGYTVSARVQRSVPGGQGGTCIDGQGSTFFGDARSTAARGGMVTLRVFARGGSLLQTRCAGPLDGDLAGVSPAARVSVARLLRGRTILHLSGTRTFAVHGFAGTLTSSLVLRLGKPSTQPQPSTPNFPSGLKTQRERIVTERLKVVRAAGDLGATVSGTSDPVVCGLLDTCGLTETLALSPAAPEFFGQVIAMGPASRPYRDFLTAMGLARGGRSRGISAVLFVSLYGRVQAEISQAGATCTDTAKTGVVSAAVGISGRPPSSGAFAGGWRTQCPGPLLTGSLNRVAVSLSPGALRRRQFTIDLTGHGSFTDDGYVISTQGMESALVRRGPVTSQVTTFPAP